MIIKREIFMLPFLLLSLATEPVQSEPVWELTGDSIPTVDSVWRPLIEQMAKPELDSLAIELSDFTISKVDFAFTIKKGKLYLFEPVEIDGLKLHYGGLFVGRGRMFFKPPIRTERDQMQRFFKSDSLVTDVRYAIIHFDQSLLAQLREAGTEIIARPGGRARKILRDGLQVDLRHTDFHHAFLHLRNIVYPQPEPALTVQTIKKRLDQLVYDYEPLRREEISLECVHPEAVGWETVCSYYQFVDETLDNIGGVSKETIDPIAYVIEATIDNKGVLWADVTMTAKVLDRSGQFLGMMLHHKVEIDGIELGDGTPVEFFRESREELYSPILGLILPTEPHTDSILTLRFRYHGEVAKNRMGMFFVSASIQWYPRYGYANKTAYKMRFKSPADYTLVASADLLESSQVGDTIITLWKTDGDEFNVTFNIADYESVSFDEEGLPKVEMYLNRAMHDVFLKDYDSDWAKDNVPPIHNSLKLFCQLFGPPARDLFRVTESLYGHGESFPGQINLPYWTFSQKDLWGEELYMQAHEVAHQWWGSTVGYETYHDQWFSEGMATYSAMRFASTELKYQFFIDKLREYRDQIFASRQSLFSKGAEAGAIIQGHRTASSKTKRDFQLIIYYKAALVMHMLRCHLTDWSTLDDSQFNNFIQEFYRRYAGKSASTHDFKSLLEEMTGIDWTWFFDQWIYGNDLPKYKFAKKIKQDQDDNLWRAYCKIEQSNVPPGFTVIMPIEIEFDKDSKKYTTFVIREQMTEFTLAFEEKPKAIRLNPFEAVLCKVEQ